MSHPITRDPLSKRVNVIFGTEQKEQTAWVGDPKTIFTFVIICIHIKVLKMFESGCPLFMMFVYLSVRDTDDNLFTRIKFFKLFESGCPLLMVFVYLSVLTCALFLIV